MDDDMLAPALKSALRNLVRSVVVVTAQHEGRPYAMAATAVSEVSMHPPSMLVCINRNAAIFQAIDAGSDLVLNVLGSDHEAVSRACGGGVRGGERFAIGAWDDGEDGRPPALRDACAVIHLKQAHVVDHGSHRIVIGDVLRVDLPSPTPPLAYFAGRYVQVAAA
ncbi:MULTISPECIES: flavin reductase family protein [Brevundimonas]|uniref:flavin reductase family protein n=1 Tax=Brevundimonas TaxID=41275 RepID=UPI00041A67D1|nr:MULTISPECIES: flavin reductase family protein [Brevundimonas]RIJ65089.1 flavin reductase [Brevundimonas sp. LPMIX5]